MSLYVKQSGALKPIETVHIKQGGVLKEIGEIWQKSGGTLIPLFKNEIHISLTVNTNYLHVSNWLAAQGVPLNSNVILTIPSNVIVYGTTSGGFALNMGDTRKYKSVHLIVNGQIQAKGGVPNSKNGSHGIRAYYPFTMTIGSTGRVYAGGGAGGAGGRGGSGQWIPEGAWVTYGHGDCFGQKNMWRDTQYCRWCNGAIGNPNNNPYLNSYKHQKHGWYRDSGLSGGSDGGNKIDYATNESVVEYEGGVGGSAPNGRGYNQSAGGVHNPANPTNSYAGAGGNSGAGGGWGTDGTAGNAGIDGKRYYYTGYAGDDTNRYNHGKVANTGLVGGGKGTRGYSIYAPNVNIYMKNYGIKLGRESYLWRAQE